MELRGGWSLHGQQVSDVSEEPGRGLPHTPGFCLLALGPQSCFPSRCHAPGKKAGQGPRTAVGRESLLTPPSPGPPFSIAASGPVSPAAPPCKRIGFSAGCAASLNKVGCCY